MARLTIEEKWWTDPRRSKLMKLLGGEDEADLAAIRLWKLAQGFWGDGRKPIPAELFDLLEAAPKLIEAKMAFVEADGIYAKGSVDYLSWLAEKRQAASEGGKKSAESRRAKTGSAQPITEANPKHNRSTAEADPTTIEPSYSGSRSLSGSEYKKEENTETKAVAVAPAETAIALKRSKFSQDTRVKMVSFIRTYAEVWKTKYKSSPEGLKDKTLIGKIGHWIEGVSEQRALDLVQVYLQVDYRPINESCHDLWQFFRHLNRIGIAMDTGQDAAGIDWNFVFGKSVP